METRACVCVFIWFVVIECVVSDFIKTCELNVKSKSKFYKETAYIKMLLFI